MKNWKRFLALLLFGAMALSLCACGFGDAQSNANATSTESDKGGFFDFFSGLFGGKESPSAAESEDPDASATPEIVVDLSQDPLEFSAGLSPRDVLLTINGEEIPADLFLYWLENNCYRFMYQYGIYVGLSVADYASELLEDTIYFCASEVLLRQRAAELGCLPTDAQVKEAQDTLDDETSELLKSIYSLSDDSIDYLVLFDAYYDNVLAALTHEPDEQELDEYLDSLGVFAVKHILLKTTDDSNQPLSDEEIAGKRSTAEDLLAQLQAAPNLEAKFDELMNEYSEDGGLATNPDGYVFDGTSSLVGGFREATLALNVGEMSGIVETDYGYHILLRLPLSEDTRTEYGASFRDYAMNDLIAQWQEGAEIVRSDALVNLDVADFYTKMVAYQQALAEQNAPDESDAVG